MRYNQLVNLLIKAYPILKKYDLNKNTEIGKAINCILMKHEGIECPKDISYTYRRKHGLLNYDVRVWGSRVKNYFKIEKIFKEIGFKDVYCLRRDKFNNCFFKAPDLSYVLKVLSKKIRRYDGTKVQSMNIKNLIDEVNKLKKEMKEIRELIKERRVVSTELPRPKYTNASYTSYDVELPTYSYIS